MYPRQLSKGYRIHFTDLKEYQKRCKTLAGVRKMEMDEFDQPILTF